MKLRGLLKKKVDLPCVGLEYVEYEVVFHIRKMYNRPVDILPPGFVINRGGRVVGIWCFEMLGRGHVM